MISTPMAADIINWAFQTEICMFNVNISEFTAIVAITSHPVETSQKMTKHTPKQKQIGSLRAFFLLIAQNAPKTLTSPYLGYRL